MLSDTIQNQDFALRILTLHLQKSRLAHTYLFSGKKGSGKEDAAAAFSCALNCENGNIMTACSCTSCRKIADDHHPDVRWIGKDLKMKSIKIEEIRQMLAWAAFKPYEGRWKSSILCGAERLTADASNALLKTLEEPPAHTIFILLVESRSHLIETIQSRCFELRFKPSANDAEDDEVAVESTPFESAQKWIDYLGRFQKLNRDDLKAALTSLAGRIRNHMKEAGPHESHSRYLEAIQTVLETRQALEANVNQKLALSRLTMKMVNL